MIKSIFHISKLDCPSEENLIRVKLSEVKGISHLDFDLAKRELVVYHTNSIETIKSAIGELNLGHKLIDSNETKEKDFISAKSQSKILWTVLLINFSFFVIEITTGLLSNSMGLVADSLDMLADSFVYFISLLAVGGSLLKKKRIAGLAGYFQLTLAVVGFSEVIRRFIGFERMPDFQMMIIVSIGALIANAVCLYILQKSKSQEAHMKASMIFTSNDIIINIGVITAGLLVFWLDSYLPDLIIGIIVFALVIRGAIRILKLR